MLWYMLKNTLIIVSATVNTGNCHWTHSSSFMPPITPNNIVAII